MSATAAGVIVAYHPPPDLPGFAARLTASGMTMFVVSNSAPAAILDALRQAGCTVIDNGHNLGLAAAINQGLAAAFASGAHDVLLLDQDSRPAPELAKRLQQARGRTPRHERVAAIGPALVDRKLTKPLAASASAPVAVAALATSGTLISRTAWHAVGPMYERLFIDGIDYEWCFRAQAKGWTTLLAPDILMPHDMGDVGINLLGRFRPFHRSPFRHYHIVRNTLLLARLPHIPLRWRIEQVAKLGYRVPLYIAGSDARSTTFALVLRGLYDGLLNRSKTLT